MPTTTQVKFLKGAFENPLSLSSTNAGSIYFDTTTKQIYVGGVAYGGAVTDATFVNNKLTVTKADNSSFSLDFSDTASAEATLKVFQHLNNLIGTATDDENLTAEYAGTHYLTSAGNLIAADKALDTAIYNLGSRIDDLDGSAVIATKTGNVITLKAGVAEDGGVISNSTDADITLATVAATGAAADVSVADTGNVFTGTNVEDVLLELSSKITNSNLTINGQVGAFTTDNTMISVDSTHKVLGVNTTGYIGTSNSGIDLVADKVDTAGNSTDDADLATVNTVKTYIGTEIAALDVDPLVLATIATDQITIAKVEEVDGKIGVNGTTTINVDGTVSSSNPLVTKSSITTAIGSLDVDGYAQGTVTGSTITVYGIKEEDGKIGSDTTKNLTITLDGNYDASDNKVALESTVTNAIEGLDVGTIQPVEYTAASGNNGAKLTFHNIAEQDGEIMLGTTGGAELQFAKVATSGNAVDVTLAAANTPYVGSNVDETIVNVDSRLKALETLPTFDTVVSTDADTTPDGVTWGNVTGTLAASSDTMHKIYLVPATRSGQSVNTYAEYITVKNDNAYTWEKVGDTSTDLTGYVRTITVNGKEYAVTTNTTDVALGNVVTSVVNGDNNLPTTGGYTSDYIQTEVTASTLSTAADGTRETTVTSAGAVKVQAVATADNDNKGLAEASDVKAYVGTQISNLKVNETTVGTNVKVTYSETNGLVTINTTEEYATIGSDLSVTNGSKLVTGNDITKVKEYISTQVSDAVEALDVADTTVSKTNISFHYREDDGKVSIGTLNEKYATVEQTGNATTTAPNLTVTGDTTGLVKGTDIETVKTYVDNKVSYEINQLDSIGTSAATGAVAQVVVEEADGKIGTVTVTNISAGVTGTANSLSASNTTGAVTGADIATIKTYIDGQVSEAATVTDTISTITVNDTNRTNIATIGTTNITAAVALVWDQYN